MRVQRGIGLLVANEACLCVLARVCFSKSSMQPAKWSFGNIGMAVAAFIDAAMRGRDRPRHQKFQIGAVGKRQNQQCADERGRPSRDGLAFGAQRAYRFAARYRCAAGSVWRGPLPAAPAKRLCPAATPGTVWPLRRGAFVTAPASAIFTGPDGAGPAMVGMSAAPYGLGLRRRAFSRSKIPQELHFMGPPKKMRKRQRYGKWSG